MTEYEEMAIEKTIISKFHHITEKLKLPNHNSLSITITITIDLYNFDRCFYAHIEPNNNMHNQRQISDIVQL